MQEIKTLLTSAELNRAHKNYLEAIALAVAEFATARSNKKNTLACQAYLFTCLTNYPDDPLFAWEKALAAIDSPKTKA